MSIRGRSVHKPSEVAPDPQPITVGFHGKIRSDGALVAVTIKQNDQLVMLTAAQAESLVRQIQEKLWHE